LQASKGDRYPYSCQVVYFPRLLQHQFSILLKTALANRMASSLTSAEIQKLQQLCEWLSNQPCQSAYSGEIIQQFPKLSHWVSVA